TLLPASCTSVSTRSENPAFWIWSVCGADFAPTFTLPNAIDPASVAIIGGPAKPESGTLMVGVFGSLVTMVRVSFEIPFIDGVKVIESRKLPPPEIATGRSGPALMVNAGVPVVMLEMVILPPPLLATVTFDDTEPPICVPPTDTGLGVTTSL